MKFFTFFTLAILSFKGFAEECQYTHTYANSGWKIHNSASFKKNAKLVSNLIALGLQNKTVVNDISGQIISNDTKDGNPVFLNAQLYDNLLTHQDIMFGDYALLTNNQEIAEVRWFDGKTRNISVNSEILNCQSEAAPYVLNSVL